MLSSFWPLWALGMHVVRRHTRRQTTQYIKEIQLKFKTYNGIETIKNLKKKSWLTDTSEWECASPLALIRGLDLKEINNGVTEENEVSWVITISKNQIDIHVKCLSLHKECLGFIFTLRGTWERGKQN